ETPAARYRKAPATRWSVRRQPWQADCPASRDESSSASALRSIVKKPIKALEAEGWTKKLDGGWVPARTLSSLQPPASSLQPPASSLQPLPILTSDPGESQHVYTAAVGVEHAEAEAVDLGDFVALGQVAEGAHHQARDGVELIVGEGAVEELVEAVDGRQRLDQEVAAGQRPNVAVFLDVVFVLDVADDLLEHILDGHQARHAAVFVDDDGHVAVVGAELAQQHVEALGLRHEGGGTQQVLDVEAVLVVLQDQRQQVLGQQHADHLVEALADHRIARVRSGDDGGEKFPRRLVGPDAHHLRARHHDVANLQVGDLDGAFDDGQRLVVEQFVLMGTAQHVQQFVAVLGFVGKSLGDLPKPGLL